MKMRLHPRNRLFRHIIGQRRCCPFHGEQGGITPAVVRAQQSALSGTAINALRIKSEPHFRTQQPAIPLSIQPPGDRQRRHVIPDKPGRSPAGEHHARSAGVTAERPAQFAQRRTLGGRGVIGGGRYARPGEGTQIGVGGRRYRPESPTEEFVCCQSDGADSYEMNRIK